MAAIAKKPSLVDDEYIIEKQGKKFALYKGLILAALENGLISLKSSVIQFPSKENGNVMICLAQAVFERDGKRLEFEDIGDACVKNVGQSMALSFMRMASTRAKARVLRDGLGYGEACLDELAGSDDEEAGASSSRQATPKVQGDYAKPVRAASDNQASDTALKTEQAQAIRSMCSRNNWALPDFATMTESQAAQWIQNAQKPAKAAA